MYSATYIHLHIYIFQSKSNIFKGGTSSLCPYFENLTNKGRIAHYFKKIYDH